MTIEGEQDAATIVDLWRIDLDSERHNIAEAQSLLSKRERNRSLSSPAASRRRRILARAALRTVLGPYTGCDPQALRFAYNAHGKPRLADVHGDCDVRFNLTTSQGCCLIAVTTGAEIGVDVEHVVPLPGIDRIAPGVFSVPEATAIRRLTGDAKLTEFYKCWTRWEAHLKARGVGLSRGGSISPSRFPEGWIHLRLRPGPGVIGALVVRTVARHATLEVRERLSAVGWT